MGKTKDLSGQKYGRLTVLAKEQTIGGRTKYTCRCDCGNICSVRSDGLTSGNTKSCGCYKRERQSESNSKNIDIGTVFSRLTVIKATGDVDNDGSKTYLCRCECGTEKIIDGTSLRTGKVLSCGCLRRERQIESVQTHGGYRDRLYHIWDSMIQRCTNHNHPSYKYYGGRGITVSDEWRNDYETFRKWAISSGYDESSNKWECTIDRIENDAGYSPSNCRWVTQKEQMNNTRKCITVTIDGNTKNLTQWAKHIGVNRKRLYKAKSRGVDMSEYIKNLLVDRGDAHGK